MFEDKIEAMNKLPNAVDDSSGFEKRVYTVEEIMDILSIGKNTAYTKKSYSVEEVQAILGITRQTVYKLIKQGCFQAVMLETGYRIIKTSFDKWLDNE